MFGNLFKKTNAVQAEQKDAVQEQVVESDSQKKIEELEWKIKSLEQEKEQLLLDRKEFMARASSEAKIQVDQSTQQAEVDKLIEMNKNSEKKIASLSEENQKLREDLKKGIESLEPSESAKELQRRNTK